MKRILAIITAAMLLTLTLAACGEGETPDNGQGGTTPGSSETGNSGNGNGNGTGNGTTSEGVPPPAWDEDGDPIDINGNKVEYDENGNSKVDFVDSWTLFSIARDAVTREGKMSGRMMMTIMDYPHSEEAIYKSPWITLETTRFTTGGKTEIYQKLDRTTGSESMTVNMYFKDGMSYQNAKIPEGDTVKIKYDLKGQEVKDPAFDAWNLIASLKEEHFKDATILHTNEGYRVTLPVTDKAAKEQIVWGGYNLNGYGAAMPETLPEISDFTVNFIIPEGSYGSGDTYQDIPLGFLDYAFLFRVDVDGLILTETSQTPGINVGIGDSAAPAESQTVQTEMVLHFFPLTVVEGDVDGTLAMVEVAPIQWPTDLDSYQLVSEE
ncbi:MAG: hypothetical protein E7486_02510 [Ruminococcaceae bacterium]|nr:hypothetical protein [Oscillospiraceae bacterium]